MVKRNTLPLAEAASTTTHEGGEWIAGLFEEAVVREIELTWSSKEQREALSESLPSIAELPRIEAVTGHRSDRASSKAGLLFQGDNLLAMQAMVGDYAGQVELIYIDPPFATGVSYYSQRVMHSSGERISQRAYRDNRARGMQTYLDTMYPRLKAMHSLLTPSGKLFLHCDWRANSMLRLLLDEIFGPGCFRNEIIWRRAPNLGRQAASKQLGRVVDTIYVYSREPGAPFRGEAPKRSRVLDLTKKGSPKGARWDEERKAYFTTAPRGDYTDASIAALRLQGRVLDSPTGKVYIKYFLSQDSKGRWVKEQPVDTLWDDYEVRPLRHCPKSEDMGYDTQKPEGLLRRIIRWATQPGDIVADFYCGSGTTLAVAQDLGRNWVGSDIGAAGVATTVRRLKSQGASFDVRSLLAVERATCLADSTRVAACLRALGSLGDEVEVDGSGWFRLEGDLAFFADANESMGAEKVVQLCRHVAAQGQRRLDVFAWRWSPRFGREELAALALELGVELSQRILNMDWLRQSANRKKQLAVPMRPALQIDVATGDSHFQLRLQGLDVAIVRQKKAEASPLWHDLVEDWMVDTNPQSDSFHACWSSQRSDADGLDLSVRLPKPLASSVVAVRVVTIFGERVDRWLRIA